MIHGVNMASERDGTEISTRRPLARERRESDCSMAETPSRTGKTCRGASVISVTGVNIGSAVVAAKAGGSVGVDD
jgi:hypothetical protein